MKFSENGKNLFCAFWPMLQYHWKVKALCGQLAIFELRSARLVLQLPCHEKAVRGPSLIRHMGRTWWERGEHAGDIVTFVM